MEVELAISRKDVEHVAKLARLTLNEEETEKFAVEIGAVLDHLRVLDSVDLTDVPPSYQAMDIRQPLRPDTPAPSLSREQALELAPEDDGNFFIVPKVV